MLWDPSISGEHHPGPSMCAADHKPREAQSPWEGCSSTEPSRPPCPRGAAPLPHCAHPKQHPNPAWVRENPNKNPIPPQKQPSAAPPTPNPSADPGVPPPPSASGHPQRPQSPQASPAFPNTRPPPLRPGHPQRLQTPHGHSRCLQRRQAPPAPPTPPFPQGIPSISNPPGTPRSGGLRPNYISQGGAAARGGRGGAGAGAGRRGAPNPGTAAGRGQPRCRSAQPRRRCPVEPSHGPAPPVSLPVAGAARLGRMQQPPGRVLGCASPALGGAVSACGRRARGGTPSRRPPAACWGARGVSANPHTDLGVQVFHPPAV